MFRNSFVINIIELLHLNIKIITPQKFNMPKIDFFYIYLYFVIDDQLIFKKMFLFFSLVYTYFTCELTYADV